MDDFLLHSHDIYNIIITSYRVINIYLRTNRFNFPNKRTVLYIHILL